VIGKVALRAEPAVFFEKSLPIILAEAGRIVTAHPVGSISHCGKAPITATLITDAEMLLANKPAVYQLENDGDVKYFAVNQKNEKRKMTAARATAFCAWYDDGVLPSSSKPDKEFYKKMSKDVMKAAMVSVHPVAGPADLSAWAQQAREMYKRDARGQLWHLRCSCEDFWHSNNRCVHVVAIASELSIVSLPRLMDGAQPRNKVGRPAIEGAREGKKVKRKDAAAWLKVIRPPAPPMRFHRHVVASKGNDADDDEDEYMIGCVKTGKKNATGKFVYVIAFDGGVQETWTDIDLANGLFNAQELGVSGIVKFDFGTTTQAPAPAPAPAAAP
jgi:hypothetical protein